MAFSWTVAFDRAVKKKILHAKQMAKSGLNPDYKLAHAGEVAAAQKGDFSLLTKRITEESKKMHDEVLRRRLKTIGK